MQSLVWSAVVLVGLSLAIGIAWWLDGRGRWGPELRARFYYGVPWGTLVSIAFVLGVYLFVQGGISDWSDPVVIPFRSWSFLYPTGLLTAGFAHGSPGHLIGNLLATAVLGPIAEYAWGHYPPDGSPDDSGSGPTAGSRWGRARDALGTPRLRAFVVFPGAILAAGLVTSVFGVGPVIGFSGVVFALGGFAMVRYPLGTVVALLVSSAVSRTYYAIVDPIVYGGTTGSAPSPPWWAEVAIQGHALGILLGISLGLLLLWYRDIRPSAGRILIAIFVYGVTRNLWAIYWFEGDGVYVLYRGLGIALVAILALLVTVAAAGRDRPLVRWLDVLPGRPSLKTVAIGWLALLAIGLTTTLALAAATGAAIAVVGTAVGVLALIAAFPAVFVLLFEWEGDPVTGRQVGIGVIVLATVLIGGMAIVPNLVTVGDDPVPNDRALDVQGYDVTYAESVRNQQIPAIDLPGAADQTNVTTSGVIVVAEDRHIWTTAVSKQFLASEGDATVTLGGVGWRSHVHVQRSGWNVAGNDTVYDVTLRHGDDAVRAFASEPSRADPVIANHTVAVEPTEQAFQLRVYRDNRSVGTAPIPAVGNATAVGPLTFRTVRDDERPTVRAIADGTNVTVVQREEYRDPQGP